MTAALDCQVQLPIHTSQMQLQPCPPFARYTSPYPRHTMIRPILLVARTGAFTRGGTNSTRWTRTLRCGGRWRQPSTGAGSSARLTVRKARVDIEYRLATSHVNRRTLPVRLPPNALRGREDRVYILASHRPHAATPNICNLVVTSAVFFRCSRHGCGQVVARLRHVAKGAA